MTRHERARAVEKKVIGLRTISSADDVNVARAARDDQAYVCAVPLNKRVDRDGRAMYQIVDRFWVQSGFMDAIQDAFDRIARRGEGFCMLDALRALVKGDQIGKRSTDVDSDPQAHPFTSFRKKSLAGGPLEGRPARNFKIGCPGAFPQTLRIFQSDILPVTSAYARRIASALRSS
jgi:hypothetical protein